MGPRGIAVVVMLATLTQGYAKNGVFSRLTQSMKQERQTTTTAADAANAAASAANAAASTANAAASAANTIASATSSTGLVDSWKTDTVLQMAQRAISGDHSAILTDMFNSKDLAALWEKPKAVQHILDGMPMLKTFKGMDQFMGRELSAEEGVKALELLKTYISAVPQKVETLLDTDKMTKKMRRYANTDDVRTKELYELIKGGDFNALKELQGKIVDKEWNGILDADSLGMNGKEPEGLKVLRERVMTKEPDFMSLIHQDDEFIKGYVEDPLKAYNEALAVAGLTV